MVEQIGNAFGFGEEDILKVQNVCMCKVLHSGLNKIAMGHTFREQHIHALSL